MTHAHYRLTSDEFLSINSQLTNAQLRVYLHYKTLDPFGDRRIEICTKAIAETLGMTQRTVQLALNKLSSLGLLIWERAKSFVTRNVDRLGEMRIAAAKSGSSRRNEDREQQLELNLQADSATSHTSSNLFKLDQELEQENFERIEDNSDISSDISLDDALEEIRKSLVDDESVDESDELLDEDLLLNNQYNQPQEVEENIEPKSDFQLTTCPNTNGTDDGKPSRAALEKFILKILNKSFTNAAQRAAYFAKFDDKSWKKWERQYKESLIPQAPYKPYIPEKVEVAPPDSPVALSAIAQIKAKLGIKK